MKPKLLRRSVWLFVCVCVCVRARVRVVSFQLRCARRNGFPFGGVGGACHEDGSGRRSLPQGILPYIDWHATSTGHSFAPLTTLSLSLSTRWSGSKFCSYGRSGSPLLGISKSQKQTLNQRQRYSMDGRAPGTFESQACTAKAAFKCRGCPKPPTRAPPKSVPTRTPKDSGYKRQRSDSTQRRGYPKGTLLDQHRSTRRPSPTQTAPVSRLRTSQPNRG